jgi:hypothetical protein
MDQAGSSYVNGTDLAPLTGPGPLLGLASTKAGRLPRVKHTVEQILAKLGEFEVVLSKKLVRCHKRGS